MHRNTLWPTLPLLTALLAGCGGGHVTPDLTRAADAPVVNALFDDEGNSMPSNPEATPADPGARTRAGRYATAAQADQLEQGRSSGVIFTRVESGPDAATAVQLAVQMAYADQVIHDLDHRVPVLVRGNDLRLAAAAANRLETDGFSNVFLVTR